MDDRLRRAKQAEEVEKFNREKQERDKLIFDRVRSRAALGVLRTALGVYHSLLLSTSC